MGCGDTGETTGLLGFDVGSIAFQVFRRSGLLSPIQAVNSTKMSVPDSPRREFSVAWHSNCRRSPQTFHFTNWLLNGEIKEFSIEQNVNFASTYRRCHYTVKSCPKKHCVVPIDSPCVVWKTEYTPLFCDKDKALWDYVFANFDVEQTRFKILFVNKTLTVQRHENCECRTLREMFPIAKSKQ